MTAPPARASYRFYRGTTFTTGPIVDKDTNGDPVDLTDYTAVFDIWREDDDPTTAAPLFHLTSDPAAGLVITPLAGSIEATIAADDTLVDVDPDGEMWPYRLTLTNTAADPDTVERVLAGWVIAQP
jgi:hypothetical protein